MRGLAIGRHTPHGSSGPTTTIQFALHDNPPPFSSRGVSLLSLQAQVALHKKGILEGLGMPHPMFVARVWPCNGWSTCHGKGMLGHRRVGGLVMDGWVGFLFAQPFNKKLNRKSDGNPNLKGLPF